MIEGLALKLALGCVGLGLLLIGFLKIRQAGRDAERAKNADATTATLEKAREAENTVASAPADELDRLRDRWTR